jgi:hypothetical protein
MKQIETRQDFETVIREKYKILFRVNVLGEGTFYGN